MASIPLAIQTPPPISPMQNIGQLMQVRDAMSQIALRNAQTQAAQQQAADVQAQAQQHARDLQSQNHIQELMGDPNVQAEIGSGNYSTILKSATPTVADSVIKNLQAMQTTAQTLAKGKADFYGSGRAMLGTGIQGLDPTDDTRAAQQYNDFLGVLGKEHPELAQQLKPIQPGPDFRQQISSLAASNGVARSILENQAALEKEQAATAASEASSSSSTATAAKTVAETPGIEAEAGLKQLEFKRAQSITPESIQARAALMFNPADYTDPAVKAQVLAERRTAIDAATNAMGQGAPAVNAAFKDSSDRLGRLTSGIASAHAQEPIKVEVNAASAAARQDVLRPDEKITANAIVEGKIAPETARAALRRNPGLLGAILKADPNFDESNIDSRYQTLKQFTNTATSSAGGQVIALNTLIHHADLYQQVADSLKNGTFKPGNSVYNSVATMFGSAPPTQTNLVARFLAGETGKIATGGVPAEGEINGLLKSLDSNNSPDQISKVGKTILQIAAGRAVPLMEKVKADHLENVVHVVGPDARGILAGRGFDPDTLKPVGGQANAVPAITSQAEYDSLPKGAHYTWNGAPHVKQ